MKLVCVHDCIEGMSCGVVSRAVKASSILKDELLGSYIRYKCKRNSEADLLAPLPEGEKRLYIYSEKNLVGSKLEAEDIDVLVEGIRPIKCSVINYSARHKAQSFTTKSRTVALITKPLHNIPGANAPKELS